MDRDVFLYNPHGVVIGDRAIISRGAYLCTATHDYQKRDFPLIGRPIHNENVCWIATEAFIGPGVTVKTGSVVGARAVVTRDVAEWVVVAGNPAKLIKKREWK